MSRPRGRYVSIVAYASIFLLLGLGLAGSLPAGNRIEAAPQLPAILTVSGPGVDCLGTRAVAVQSGVFVDLHVPGHHGNADEDIEDRIIGGVIDRLDGTGTWEGTCAPATVFEGRQVEASVEVAGENGATGVLTIDGVASDFVMVAETELPAGLEQGERLEGGELLARLFLAVVVVIVMARLLGSLFGRMRQPRVIGEIVAGILLGPSLLGLIFPEVTRYLFPASVTDVLSVLAQFGLIFFMFLIGLELDHKMIRGSGHTAVLISHYSIVVPFTLGLLAALLVYPLVGSGDFTGFALFMGASMAITAFPVLARILTDTGLHRTRLGALAITCAAVDDVTAWCVLAVVVAIVKATGMMDAVATVTLALAFVLAMLLVVRPLLARIMSVYEGRQRIGATVMSALIAGLFLSSWATEVIGIHAIFGAFMFGAVLPRSRSLTTQVTERLEDVTVLFLLPVFFAVVGLSTQIGLVSGRQMWLLAGLIVAIAIIGKIGGSVVAGLAAGETLRSSTIIGVLMNARGITEIVILTIGRSLGVISPALFTIMVMMALVTTFMTTPLLNVLYPRRLVDADIAADLGETSPQVEAPRDAAVRRTLRRVMVGVTDPVAARPLVDIVRGMTRGGVPIEVTLATVVVPPGHEQVRANLAGIEEQATHAAESLVIVQEELEQSGLYVDALTVTGTNPAEELWRLAAQRDIDLLLIGSHEAYLGFRPLGGVAGEILRDAPCEVAVLVGLDSTAPVSIAPITAWYRGDGPDEPALIMASRLAAGARVSLRVVSPVAVTVPDTDVATEVVVLDAPKVSDALAVVSDSQLVVVAPPGVGGVLPGLREAVIERATAPVLVVRGALHAATPEETDLLPSDA